MDVNQFIFRARDLTAQQGIVATVFGEAGVGKTTIANACWPSPVFIPVEPGLLSVPDAIAFQRPQSSGEVIGYLQSIATAIQSGNFAYKTVVIDSVSEFETMATRDLCSQHGVASLGALKGWGNNGWTMLGNVHRQVREECEKIKLLGVNVVFIAHSIAKVHEPPDAAPFARWELQVGKSGSAQYLNQVDVALHVKNAMQMVKIAGTQTEIPQAIKNKRILDMVSKPGSVAKNRFGVDSEICFTWSVDQSEFVNPLAPIFGFDNAV